MNHLLKYSLFEGRTMRSSKSGDNDVKKYGFKESIENLIKSLEFSYITVGDDLEVKKDEIVIQIMFRDDYISIKKSTNKFGKEFTYKQLGKVKKELKEILL